MTASEPKNTPEPTPAKEAPAASGPSGPKQNTTLLVAIGGFVVLGAGALVSVGLPGTSDGAGKPSPATPQDRVVECLDTVLDRQKETQHIRGAELKGALAGFANGELSAENKRVLSETRKNDKDVLKLAVTQCGTLVKGHFQRNARIEFRAEVLRDDRPVKGVKVHHNVGGADQCVTDEQGSCLLSIIPDITEMITLTAEHTRVEVPPEDFNSARPVTIQLGKSGERAFFVKVVELGHAGELDLNLEPTFGDGDGELRNEQCATQNEEQSPECLAARTEGQRAKFRFRGDMSELTVKATFGTERAELTIPGDEIGSLVEFNWKKARAGKGSGTPRPSCASSTAKAKFSYLVKHLPWTNSGRASAMVGPDGRLSGVQAAGGNASRIDGKQVGSPGNCAPERIFASYTRSLSQ